MKITIELDDQEVAVLKKRAKKNMFEIKEQVEDIIRRSCINAKKTGSSEAKCDDRLVGIFSREKRRKKI